MFSGLVFSEKIIVVSSASTKYWKLNSCDRLRIPKPFGTIYVSFSKPLDYQDDRSENADRLTNFINVCQDEIDNKTMC